MAKNFSLQKYSAINATLCPVSLVLRRARAAFHDGGGVDAVDVFEVLYIWERDFLGERCYAICFFFLIFFFFFVLLLFLIFFFR